MGSWMRITVLRLCLLASRCSWSAAQYGPDPTGVPAEFMCGWRQLALQYGQTLRPDAAPLLEDALRIDSYCAKKDLLSRKTSDAVGSKASWKRDHGGADAAKVVYVDGQHGADDAPGTKSQPLRSIQAAIGRARQMRGARSVIIRAGTYYTPALELTAADSGLTIAAADSEEVWLSGGVPLAGKWKRHAGRVWSLDLSALDLGSIATLRVDGRRLNPARFPNADPETRALPRLDPALSFGAVR